MALDQLLDPEDIHLHFRAGSVIEAIPSLLRPALMRRFQNPELVDAAIDAVLEREQETSTMCGAISLPHARTADAGRFILSLGANSEGAIEGRRDPRLIFAFVSPEEKRDEHLRLLASLARLSQNAKVVDQIASASSADQVIDALRAAGL